MRCQWKSVQASCSSHLPVNPVDFISCGVITPELPMTLCNYAPIERNQKEVFLNSGREIILYRWMCRNGVGQSFQKSAPSFGLWLALRK